MYNHTGLQGRLTADPELRYTQQGTAITSFTLASDTGRKTKDGKKITNFIECVAWAILRAPATSRRSRTMATFHFNLTAGRPADDQKQATNKRPQKGGDDRGMAASASDTQGSPQTVRRC